MRKNVYIGDYMIKKKAYYQKQYPEFLTGGIEHPTRKTKQGKSIMIHTKGHLHNMAKRKAGKVFLQHLWVKWRELEGLSISDPWIIAHGGHENYIKPTP